MSSFSSFSIRVDGLPKTKARPRLGRRRRVYTPQATLDAEAIIAEAWVAAGGPCFEGPVHMDVQYDKLGQTITITEVADGSKMRGDLDNYVKLTGDALNGVAFKDDRQVVAITATKH